MPEYITAHYKSRLDESDISIMEELISEGPETTQVHVTFRQNLVGRTKNIIDWMADQVFLSLEDLNIHLHTPEMHWEGNIRATFKDIEAVDGFPYLSITFKQLKELSLIHPKKFHYLEEKAAKVLRDSILLMLAERMRQSS